MSTQNELITDDSMITYEKKLKQFLKKFYPATSNTFNSRINNLENYLRISNNLLKHEQIKTQKLIENLYNKLNSMNYSEENQGIHKFSHYRKLEEEAALSTWYKRVTGGKTIDFVNPKGYNEKIQWKKVLLNSNFIAIYIGVAAFLFGISFPTVVEVAINDFGGMIGTVSMFAIGMLIGNQDLKALFIQPRIYMVCALRLVVLPVIMVFAFWGIQKVVYHPDLHYILMIVLWGVCAPVGAMVTQLSQLYGGDSKYAGQINVVSVLCCAITMPFVTYLYEFMMKL